MGIERLNNNIEAVMLAISSVFVAWMIKRAKETSMFGYNTMLNNYGAFLKLVFVLSIIGSLSQIAIAVVKITDEDGKDMSPFLFNGYTLLAEYTIIAITGWVTSCVILKIKHRLLDQTREWSLILFWAFYFILHTTSGTLRVIDNDYGSGLDISELILHYFLGASCFFLVFISLCNWTNSTEEDSFRRTSIRNYSLLSEYSFNLALRIGARKYKVVDNEIMCTIKATINGSERELKKSYTSFVLFDLKLEKKHEQDIRKGVFNKPKLPDKTAIKSIEDMGAFQQQFDTYLSQLAQDLTDEFIEFLSEDSERNFTKTFSDCDSSGLKLTLNNSNLSYSLNTDLVRKFWTTERFANVTLNLNEFVTEGFIYVIQIIYKDESHTIQKKRAETIEFYTKMADNHKIKKSTHLLKLENIEMDKATLKDVERFHIEVLNNADLFCDDVWNYFGYRVTEIPRYIHSILQSQASILKDFKVIGKVDKAEFKLDKKKNIQIVLL